MLLPDCTLFPHGGLPLFIFEPRYRKMLRDALEGDCLFAVGTLRPDLGTPSGDPARDAAKVGTLGLIRASREQADGTSHLLLHGVTRVSFTAWHGEQDYPCATIEPRATRFSPTGKADAAMKTLRAAVEDALEGFEEEVRKGVFQLLERADSPELMTDIVCQQFVHEPRTRQLLLETDSAADRIPIICDYLIRARAGGQD